MIAYKLTEQDNTTYNHSTLWGNGVTHQVNNRGRTLCSNEVIHVYSDPVLAVLMNPIHAAINNPKLWKCRITKPVADDGTKLGTKKCTTIKETPIPNITTEQRVTFAILCAKIVYKDKDWNTWADNWLKGIDRSTAAAHAAHEGIYPAPASARAADSAAASAATRAAAHAAASAAANAVANAAARAAAYSSASTAAYATQINLVEIVHKMMEVNNG